MCVSLCDREREREEWKDTNRDRERRKSGWEKMKERRRVVFWYILSPEIPSFFRDFFPPSLSPIHFLHHHFSLIPRL